MSKRITSAYVAVFLLLFIMPSIIYFFFGDFFDRASSEQRSTAEKPTFSLESIADYPKAYEAYYNDHVPFRTQMIEANSILDYFLFKQSPVSKVIIGKDGWLFYNPAGTDGDPVADFNGENLYSLEQLQAMAENLISTRDALQADGKEFVIYIAPNKECIYGTDYFPSEFVRDGSYTRADQVVAYLSENTDLTIVYPKAELLRMIEKYPQYNFYYKTDTHWNELGAYVGARELLRALDVSIPQLNAVEISQISPFSGDLANMMGLSDYIKYDSSYSVTGYSKIPNAPDVCITEGGNIHTFTTNNANPKSVMIIRDSFSLNMMSYIAPQFNSCSFVHRAKYTPESLTQIPSDIVVFQVVERYTDDLFSCPIV